MIKIFIDNATFCCRFVIVGTISFNCHFIHSMVNALFNCLFIYFKPHNISYSNVFFRFFLLKASLILSLAQLSPSLLLSFPPTFEFCSPLPCLLDQLLGLVFRIMVFHASKFMLSRQDFLPQLGVRGLIQNCLPGCPILIISLPGAPPGLPEHLLCP